MLSHPKLTFRALHMLMYLNLCYVNFTHPEFFFHLDLRCWANSHWALLQISSVFIYFSVWLLMLVLVSDFNLLTTAWLARLETSELSVLNIFWGCALWFLETFQTELFMIIWNSLAVLLKLMVIMCFVFKIDFINCVKIGVLNIVGKSA